MSFFTRVEDSHVLLRTKGGVFKEVPIYKHGKFLFAKTGSSFIRLKKNNATSVLNQFWDEIDLDPMNGKLEFERLNAVLKPARKPRLVKSA